MVAESHQLVSVSANPGLKLIDVKKVRHSGLDPESVIQIPDQVRDDKACNNEVLF